MNAIAKAVKNVDGGQAQMARDLGVSPQFVNQLVKGRRPVPPKIALKIESRYGVSRHELNPEFFGSEPANQADAG